MNLNSKKRGPFETFMKKMTKLVGWVLIKSLGETSLIFYLCQHIINKRRARKPSATFFMKECCMAKKYKHITLDERALIQTQLQQDLNLVQLPWAWTVLVHVSHVNLLVMVGKHLPHLALLDVPPLQVAILPAEQTFVLVIYQSCRVSSASWWSAMRYGKK